MNAMKAAIGIVWACSFAGAQIPDVRPQIAGRSVQEGQVTIVYLAPRFATAIRMPDAINSVVLGDPASFTAEHSEREPKIVFVKPITEKATQTNLLISTTHGYQNFSQILNTARGTNTAFLFSMQSLPQLLKVGKGFKEDVTSAPNTKIALRTQDEETARYFIRASAEHAVTRRTQSLVRQQLFGFERFEKGMSATEREEREYRAEDEKIKNLPKGQMQILMTDDSRGTLHQHLHVRTPPEIALPGFDWELLPRLRHSRSEQRGANLRFKDPELANSAWGRRGPGGRR